jgi:cytochrome oxidase Cu insertion factor (SCO1/SenC/PrrC family)
MKRILMAAVLAGCSGQASSTAPAAAPSSPPAAAAAPDEKRAPDFTLNDTEGKPVALHDLLAKGPVILAFFPKAFTGG